MLVELVALLVVLWGDLLVASSVPGSGRYLGFRTRVLLGSGAYLTGLVLAAATVPAPLGTAVVVLAVLELLLLVPSLARGPPPITADVDFDAADATLRSQGVPPADVDALVARMRESLAAVRDEETATDGGEDVPPDERPNPGDSPTDVEKRSEGAAARGHADGCGLRRVRIGTPPCVDHCTVDDAVEDELRRLRFVFQTIPAGDSVWFFVWAFASLLTPLSVTKQFARLIPYGGVYFTWLYGGAGFSDTPRLLFNARHDLRCLDADACRITYSRWPGGRTQARASDGPLSASIAPGVERVGDDVLEYHPTMECTLGYRYNFEFTGGGSLGGELSAVVASGNGSVEGSGTVGWTPSELTSGTRPVGDFRWRCVPVDAA